MGWLEGIEETLESQWGFIVTASLLLSLIYSESLLMQVAYDFDELGPRAVKAAIYVLIWMLLTSVATFGVDMKLASSGRGSFVYLHSVVVCCCATVAYFIARPALPALPITVASFQTNTAQAAYLKDVCYCVVLAVFFLVLPFNFIFAVEHDLRRGDFFWLAKLLSGSSALSVPPMRAIFLHLKYLWVLLGLIALVVIYSSAHLISHLRPESHMNLYLQLLYLRWFLYFALAFVGLGWYHQQLRRLQAKSLQAEELQ